MAVPGPNLAEDLDLVWAVAFAPSLLEITQSQLEFYVPCILQYLDKISHTQKLLLSDDALGKEGDSNAINSLARLLVERAVSDASIAQTLFWQLRTLSRNSWAQHYVWRENIFSILLDLLLGTLKRVQSPPHTRLRFRT